jgi:hypothetical protein
MPAWVKFNKFIRNQFFPNTDVDHQVDWKNDTIKVAIVQAGGGAPNVADGGSETWSEVKATNAEVSGTGYTAGGIALTVSHALASGVVTLSASADPSWAQNGAGFTNGRYFVLYADKGAADTDKPVIAYLDPGQTLNQQNATITLDLQANEILSAT